MSADQLTDSQLDLEEAVKDYLETGSQESREDVIRLGRNMAEYFAGIYSAGNVDEGLKRSASSGFLKALKRFDPAKEVPFSTYATHCIISEIREELKNRQLFRVPDWLRKLQDDVIRATEELAAENQMMPTLQEIANKVNIDENGIAETMQAGIVKTNDLNYRSIKSLRHKAFKLPVEDVIKIRKSLDRLGDIQLKVLSLFSANLRELRLAMEEEEKALGREQAQYLSVVENGSELGNLQPVSSFKLDFPDRFHDHDLRRYFEVLSDEFGLHLTKISFGGRTKTDDEGYDAAIEVVLEGRYRGLLQLLDYLRSDEDNVQVDRVHTVRNENIPARINICLNLSAEFSNLDQNDDLPTQFN
jgi:RNA polymerase sigma-B factor